MRSLLTSCLWGGEKEKGAARKEDVEDCEALLDARHAPIWEPLSWEATLFSMAIVTSDAKEVLFKKRGLEPAAAGLLDQALLLDGTSHPLNAPLAQKEGVTPAPLSRNTCSFLTALLGPELEAVAVSTARRNRWWKGTISAKLPVQPVKDVAPVGSGGGASRSNPSMTQLRLQGPAPGSSAGCQERALPKRKPSLLEESMIRVSVRSEGTPADTMAAKATEARDRQGSAPMELCSADPRSSGDSSVKGEGRMEIKASSSSLRQDDGSKRVQWSCPEVGLEGTRSKSSPLSSPLGRINEGVPAIRMQIQSSPQASVHSPVMSAPIHRTVRAGRPAVRKSKSCLSQPNRGLVEEREEGEEEEEEGKHSPGSLFRGSSTRSKRGQKEGKLTVSRGPSFSRRSSLLLTPAIEHLVEQGGGTEEGATRTVALLKSLSQGAKNEARQVSEERPAQDFGVQCASAPSARHQQLFDSVVRGTLSYSSVPSSEPPSNLSDMSNTVHAAAPHSAALPSSIQAHENMQGAEPTISVALSPFGNVSGSTNSNPPSAGAVGYSNRSVEGPHLLCQTATANSTEQRTYTSKPSTFPHSSHRASSSTVLSWETPFEDSNHPVGSANPLYQELLQHGSSSQLGAYQSTPLEPAIQTSPSASEDEAEIPTQSFDVMVTTLSEDARSPLLVSIFNCTEHWQVRATLTTLAEQQLELLSSLLPQHAIQNVELGKHGTSWQKV
ncbi:hypothetical protein DUNSADRAFT_17387 [Dunaliella salina]|uniref:Uncharacterized protein n=1 Tax=Dunaliella salina TaxID=3046 RepID=A0ABQ7G1U9_DUNSA|nr:hypothetical protein DUNSADRAFT_17387 [Dunaliella salina]|eukprot:KAF5828583.1 hypothetical protein DUNSADRAFT_17387 [Dunaliella salina]